MFKAEFISSDGSFRTVKIPKVSSLVEAAIEANSIAIKTKWICKSVLLDSESAKHWLIKLHFLKEMDVIAGEGLLSLDEDLKDVSISEVFSVLSDFCSYHGFDKTMSYLAENYETDLE